jgi:putative restriction endonuclease
MMHPETTALAAAFRAVRPPTGVTPEEQNNFWRPGGGSAFRALTVGEPFFFKTHAPHNRVVGGGFFSGFAALRVSEAWSMLGEANGAVSLERMRERIAHYRREPIGPHDDPEIGCVFIRDVTFFPDDMAQDPPPGFALNIVQGKGYDMADSHGHCAITGNKIRPVLQAAHIRPVSSGGENRLDNGMLLRSDVHRMFDDGYLAVDPAHRLVVSPRLRADFGNGEEFYAKAGTIIELPDRKTDRPSREFLEWHLETVYKSA